MFGPLADAFMEVHACPMSVKDKAGFFIRGALQFNAADTMQFWPYNPGMNNLHEFEKRCFCPLLQLTQRM